MLDESSPPLPPERDFVALAKQSLLQPRVVIRKVIDYDATFMTSRLIGYTGLLSGYSPLLELNLLIMNLLLTVGFAYFTAYLTAASFWAAGKLLSAKVPFQHVLAATAWSLIPTFMGAMVQVASSVGGEPIYLIGQIVFLLGVVWSMKLLIWMMAEVQQFSLFKSMVSSIIALVLSAIPFIPVVFLLKPYWALIQQGIRSLIGF